MNINVLIVEDNEDDALLLVRALEKGGNEINYRRVDTREELSEALGEGIWQLILTDHSLPGFNSLTVLEMVKRSGDDIPVIIVSGVIPEQDAVAAMRLGANDYLMKDNLARLIPVVERELREVETRRAKLRAERALTHMAYHDSLTNLINRSMLHDKLEQAIHQSRRAGTQVALLFIDLDRFKTINDTFGNIIGDLLLKEAADRLRSCTSERDIIARYGGDEFIVVLENVASEADAGVVAEYIISSMAKPFRIDNKEMFISSSIGIAMSGIDAMRGDLLIQQADTAMIRAKQRGRNTYQFFAPEMGLDVEQRKQLEQALHQALKRNEFELFYQPQKYIKNDRIRGAEALLRWRHPEKGMIPPGMFIDLLEKTGLIISVGDWVLRTACRQWRQWMDEGYIPPDFVVSVNISSYQFRGSDLAASVRRILNETGLPPSMLDLEITESTLMEDTEACQEVLQELKDMGVHISIDDFGTGYSSLIYLKKFPIDSLKIDQSFVRDIGKCQDDEVIATAIIGLSHNLRMKVIAEGVETNDILGFLADRHCDMYQGYYFSKPLPGGDFVQFVRENPGGQITTH